MYIYIYLFFMYTHAYLRSYTVNSTSFMRPTRQLKLWGRPDQNNQQNTTGTRGVFRWRENIHVYHIYIYTYRCRDLSQVHHPGKIDEKPGRKLNFWVDFLKFLWTSRCSRCTSSRFLAWISTHRMVDVTTEYWPQGQGAETDGWSGSGEFTIKLSLWYLQGGPGP